MTKNKTQRIIENIFDIIQNTDFKDEALKQYQKDTKNMHIELDCKANTINYYGINDQLLFGIKINN
jgi:hypothetical protein